MLKLIFFALISTQLQAFDDLTRWQQNFLEVSYQELETEFSAQAAQQLPLVVVKSQSSTYTKEEILKEVNLMNLIYRPCSVAFNTIHFYEVLDEQDGRYNRYEFLTHRSLDTLRQKVPLEQPIAIAFFVGEILDQDKSSGFSFARWTNNLGLRPNLYNSVVLSNYSRSDEYRDFNPKRYSLLAHEFMHVLTRRGQHISPEFKSLMSISSARTNRVRAKTCEYVYNNSDLKWDTPLLP